MEKNGEKNYQEPKLFDYKNYQKLYYDSEKMVSQKEIEVLLNRTDKEFFWQTQSLCENIAKHNGFLKLMLSGLQRAAEALPLSKKPELLEEFREILSKMSDAMYREENLPGDSELQKEEAGYLRELHAVLAKAGANEEVLEPATIVSWGEEEFEKQYREMEKEIKVKEKTRGEVTEQ